MKRCPQCSALACREQASCECGYAFAGDEAEVVPTEEEIRAIEEREDRKLDQSTAKINRVIILSGTLLGSFMMLAAGIQSGSVMILVGLVGAAVSCTGFAISMVRSRSKNILVTLAAVTLVILSIICTGLAVIGAACAAMMPPGF